MESSTKDQAEGKFHRIKGKLKELAGKLSDNPKLEAEGTGEKIAGKVQKRREEKMRYSVKDLKGYAIGATDDDIGKLDDFYFDDESWTDPSKAMSYPTHPDIDGIHNLLR